MMIAALVCCSGYQLSAKYLLWSDTDIANMGKYLKKTVNRSFDKACDMSPHTLDTLDKSCDGQLVSMPLLTDIADNTIEFVNEDGKIFVLLTIEGTKHKISRKNFINIMNVSREMVYAAHQNKKPQSSWFMPIIPLFPAYNPLNTDVNVNMTVQNEQLAWQMHQMSEAQKLAAWQSNPDKIDDDTAAGLLSCDQSMIENNHTLHPTWQNWSLTWGLNGRRIFRSTVGLAAAVFGLPYGREKYLQHVAKTDDAVKARVYKNDDNDNPQFRNFLDRDWDGYDFGIVTAAVALLVASLYGYSTSGNIEKVKFDVVE